MDKIDELLPEGEDLEIKSKYTSGLQDRGTLVKTIVAMANTSGGTIVLEELTIDIRELDSARLDDLVNKYIEPRIADLVSRTVDGNVEILVPESKRKPHIFTSDLLYQHKGKQKGAFYPGQIWVRHSSKNEPATADDLERMLRQRASQLLGDLSVSIQNPSFPLRLTGDDGLPIHLKSSAAPEGAAITMELSDKGEVPIRVSDSQDAVPVNLDINRHYPYSTSGVGRELGKSQNWVAGAAKILKIRDNPMYHYCVRNGDGTPIASRYNDAAIDLMRREDAQRPNWHPWAEAMRK